MSADAWFQLWSIVLVLGVTAFFVVGLVLAPLGARELVELLRIGTRNEEKEERETTSD